MDINAIRTNSTRPLDWVNILFLALTPVVAVLGTSWYVYYNGVTWLEIANFFFMFLATGLAITCGYHRYYTHCTHECSKAVQLFYLIFGAAAVENSVVNWASDHRYHHRYVDKDEDPYNILRGGLYAHIGWIFYKDTRQIHQKYQNIPDLTKDPLVLWQDRWYLPIIVLASFALPAYIGLMQGRPVGGLLWGGFLRVVIVHHMTFFINSLAHIYGTRPYTEENSARDNWMLGPFTFGEGYHNFHHKFQADYRNGIHWYHFDMGKWLLFFFKTIGVAWNFRKVSDAIILKAKLEVEMRNVAKNLAAVGAPQKMWDKVQSRLEVGRLRLEQAMVQYHEAKIEYGHRKDEWSAEAHRQWDAKIAEYRSEFKEAKTRWRSMIRAMNRIPHPSAQGLLTFTALVDILKARL